MCWCGKKKSPMMAHGSVALLSLSKMEQKPGRPSVTVAEMIARCLGQNNWSKCHRGEQRRELPASATRLQELERRTELREKPVLNTTFILCVWTCEEERTADDGVFTHVGQNGEMQQDGESPLSRILCSEANHEQRGSSGGLWFRVFS